MVMLACYLHRHKLAFLLTLLVAGTAVAVPWSKLRAAPVEHREVPPAMQVELSIEPPPPVEPPQPKPQPEPPKPQPAARTPAPTQPVRSNAVVVPVAAAPENTAARSAEVLAAAAPAPLAKPVESTVHPVAAPEPPPPPPPPANTNASFADRVRQLINSNKAYPTGREISVQKPEGTVEVCVVLARNGEIVDSSIRESAGSILLDQAAKRLVARLRYPSFDDTAFKGQEQHEFCARLKYEVPKN